MPHKHPVFDLHCDMPGYLSYIDKLSPMNTDDIGCAIPHLQKGNVHLQVMAIFSPPKPKKKKDPQKAQVRMYRRLLEEYAEYLEPLLDQNGQPDFTWRERIKVISAVENATVFCKKGESLDSGFNNLEKLIKDCKRPLYIGFTHWSENRFGGGNDCHVGLKPDGKALLDYLDGRQIAVDFAHASDELAHDILNHIDKHNLDIRVIASHSNFRPLCGHDRNLPDTLAKEVISRKGLIGMNFMRPYIDKKNPRVLIDHIMYGFNLGAEDAICFGADFFYEKPMLKKPGAVSNYFPDHSNAGKYPAIIKALRNELNNDQIEKLCWKNAAGFIEKLLLP